MVQYIGVEAVCVGAVHGQSAAAGCLPLYASLRSLCSADSFLAVCEPTKKMCVSKKKTEMYGSVNRRMTIYFCCGTFERMSLLMFCMYDSKRKCVYVSLSRLAFIVGFLYIHVSSYASSLVDHQ